MSWVAVDFDPAIQPGPKKFDFYLAQVSYSAERAAAVDLSDGYFDDTQAVVALKANAISKVTTVAGLKDFRLGTQVGTTSLKYITDNIQPTKQPRVYNSLDAGREGAPGQADRWSRRRPRTPRSTCATRS